MNENCLQFINRFSNELKKIYSTSTLNAYQSIINDFLIYCEKENILSFSRRIADKYISKISECDMPSNFNSYVRIVNMLVYFEKFDKIPYRSRLVELNWPGWFYPMPNHIHPHVLRHSRAMHLLQSGVNLVYIRDLLGHSSITTTEIYARADTEIKRKAIENASPIIQTNVAGEWENNKKLLDWLKSL